MGKSILSNVDKFASSSIESDLKRIGEFFDIPKSSPTMNTLIGSSASSISRAKTGQSSLRAAKHIAVVAAFTFELEKHLNKSKPPDEPSRANPANMHRWLLSGQMRVKGVPRIPINVLADYELAVTALNDVRMELHPNPSERPDGEAADETGSTSPPE
jgi:hypothetical protein